ncbi:MAG: hypothetical protein COW63_01620 [Bacteroidetes bacterium CG18_big_fil_WC_8_21_14_2_50_41_14]|nr:MAG: hypothetical protein COW63_01620 [Bacteroidetes bacterium CG18_big_fil_WC_8_21_14_2_50_41_14]PIY30892.1 MAG: hypothetical protein COZ08_10350 [Bacteroidetes bacterium CG_4_10_14_3_um_filter_42_6]PJB56147.1 MAG: hypothetical protein CO098_14795 [Bacteroidetes bacterium CG_4_9_14_3_um_filter_41_19]
MKKIVQVILAVIIIGLGYLVYESIMEPVRFKKEKSSREKMVIQKLKDIRSSQVIYKQLKGSYATSFDTLISFLKVAEIPVVKIIPDPTDTTYTRTISDTVGFINVADSLFSKIKNFSFTTFKTIPYSGGEFFEMKADTTERGGVKVHVFEAKAPFTAYLKGMDEQSIINLNAKFEDIDKYPGLKVGSLVEPSTDGNWE